MNPFIKNNLGRCPTCGLMVDKKWWHKKIDGKFYHLKCLPSEESK